MRLAGVEDGRGGPTAWVAFWLSRLKYGSVLEPLRLYAHRPRILRAFLRLYRAVEKSGALPRRLKALAMVRVARLVGCPF